VEARAAHRPGVRVSLQPRRLWAAVFGIPAAAVGTLFLLGMLVAHDELEGLPTARVRRGDVAITIDEPGVIAASSQRVETQVGAADLARVRPESRAEIRLDSVPGVVFAGRVVSVAAVAREKVSRTTGLPTGIEVFDVVVEPLEHDARLRAGLAAGVQILVNQYLGALYVPVAAVFLDDLDRPTVYVRTGRWAEARPVELVASDDRVAVLGAGVEEGDEILIALPPTE
jgi:multidrug efflux pump subunit AcrA (membrane-fusion protein)